MKLWKSLSHDYQSQPKKEGRRPKCPLYVAGTWKPETTALSNTDFLFFLFLERRAEEDYDEEVEEELQDEVRTWKQDSYRKQAWVLF